jgi:hypothetical protein
LLSPAFEDVTAHVPLAFVTDSTAPDTVHPVEAPVLNVTAPVPLPPLEVNVAVLPNVRLAGAFTVSVACVAFCSVTVAAAEVAALKLLSAAFVAVTAHEPLASVTDSTAPETAQPVEAPALNVTAPEPLPPLDVSVAVLPNVRLGGAFTVSVAWFALFTVWLTPVEVLLLKLLSPP